MPIIDLQRRFRELGRIRLGEKGEKKTERGVVQFPVKLTEFRLTSGSRDLLDVAADLYGGTVEKWDGAPNDGQWQLKTGCDRLDVYLPPGEPITQWNEMWSGGGCVRRCDGRTNVLVDGPCECPADLDTRIEASKTGKACKPTTRLSVMLPRLPDVGVWRLETHGYNAALELPGTVAILQAALDRGQMIPAQLRLEQRTSVKDGQTRQFVVPVLELPTLSFHTLSTGEVPAGVVTMGSVGELGAGDRRALPAGESADGGATASHGAASGTGDAPAATGADPGPLSTVEQREKLFSLRESLCHEFVELARARWKKEILPPHAPDDPQMPAALAEKAAGLLEDVLKQQKKTFDKRRKHVRAKFTEAGVSDEADVDAIVEAATRSLGDESLVTSSTAELSAAQEAAIVDQLAPLIEARNNEPTDDPAEVA